MASDTTDLGECTVMVDTGMSEVIISASGLFASLAALRRENSCHDLTQQAKRFQMLANDC